MSLPSPHLDDRSFQDIVDEVKLQIGRRCPEWTDHNVSDPGVTLIELFAWMFEMMLFRLNQVPEKNYVKFLEMIGISLESPTPAKTDLRFQLSQPIEEGLGVESSLTLPARRTVAATVRTEFEEAVEFATDEDLVMVSPDLSYIFAIPEYVGEDRLGQPLDGDEIRPFRNRPQDFEYAYAIVAQSGDGSTPNGGNTDGSTALNTAVNVQPQGRTGFPIYSPVPPIQGDALYFGFRNNVSGNVVQLEVDGVTSAATELRPDYPSQVWEYWNGQENRWDRLEVDDFSDGFNLQAGKGRYRDLSGKINLALPQSLLPRQIHGMEGFWVRSRYTTDPKDLPPKGRDGKLEPAVYTKSPEILTVGARVIGGTTLSSNSQVTLFKVLGQSDGTPGQVFALGQAPILPLGKGETILVGEEGKDYEEWEEWEQVDDFAESGPNDPHFTCDTYTGDIYFGPSIPQPIGPPRQHGKFPRKGLTIVLSGFRFGGGARGNVLAGQVNVLKSTIPYIGDVTNPSNAIGGQDQEVLERAKLRGRALLRLRDRAVTAEDFEYLAEQASKGVGRARCVRPRALHTSTPDESVVPPGVVRVLLIPTLSQESTTPRPRDLKVPAYVKQEVEDYLDQRRLLTTVLDVGEPEYVYVSTDIELVADPKANPDFVMQAVRSRLEMFLHPLRGGPNRDGWPFRRTFTLADLYAQVQEARGVAFLLDAKIYRSSLMNEEDGLLSEEVKVENKDGVQIAEHQLLCSREHRVRVVPMWAVGQSHAGAGGAP